MTLRVLVATPLGPGGRGGIDRIMDELRRELRVVQPEGVAVRFVTTRGPGHLALAPFYLGWAVLLLAGLRLVHRVDVLHVNLSSHGSTVRKLVLCRAAQALGVPYVLHLHGSRFRQFHDTRGRWMAGQVAAMFEGAATTLVLGRAWREFLLQRVPGLAGRVRILPNASRAPDRVDEPSGPPTILFLGRIGARKGVPQLLEALHRLPRMPPWRAIIAGDGDPAPTRAELARLGLADAVTLTGWVGPADVERLLAAAAILALPSFDENLPMSVIEAMAHGLAIVATPVGAVEDIVVPERTGLLVPPGDVAALAQALGRLVGDAALRARLGAAARRFHRSHLAIAPYLGRLLGVWREAARAASAAGERSLQAQPGE